MKVRKSGSRGESIHGSLLVAGRGLAIAPVSRNVKKFEGKKKARGGPCVWTMHL